LKRSAGHHGGEQAHGGARGTGDAARRGLHATDDVSAADHNRDFGAQLPGAYQISGDPVDGWLIDAEGLRAGEVFARDLDHHATVNRLSHCESLSLANPTAPSASPPGGPAK